MNVECNRWKEETHESDRLSLMKASKTDLTANEYQKSAFMEEFEGKRSENETKTSQMEEKDHKDE